MAIPIVVLNADDEKTQLTIRRLLLAKQFFLHGIDHSDKSGPINQMISLHNLHNAVEIVLRAIFLHFEIRPERELNIGFENMLAELNNHSTFRDQEIRLPYRQEMRTLNQMRNLVQHNASIPTTTIIEESRVFVRRFLVDTYDTFFGCDFESMNLVSMIADKHLRDLLELASLEITKGDLKKALSLVGVSFSWASAALSTIIPESSWLLGRFGELHEFSYNLGQVLDSFKLDSDKPFAYRPSKGYEKSFPELIKFEQRLSDDLKLVEKSAARYSALLASGVDIVDYKRFRQCTPITYFQGYSEISEGKKTTKRSIHFQWDDKEPITEDAVWVHTFIVNSIVRWQMMGLIPEVNEKRKNDVRRLLEWGDDITLG